jgi:hypothetical protein
MFNAEIVRVDINTLISWGRWGSRYNFIM